MRHKQATLHVTEQAKLSLIVQVELEAANSLVVNGQRVIIVGFVSNQTLIRRQSGCHLEKLRYRLLAGDNREPDETLSPWNCREQFLRDGTSLRKYHAEVIPEKHRRGVGVSSANVRSNNNSVELWALGPHGVAGNYQLWNVQEHGDWPKSPIEASLEEECVGWRGLLRDVLQTDYANWRQLESKYPVAWMRELFMPLPLAIGTMEGAPTGRVVCQSLLDVLIVTTQLDGIRGLRRRICKAEGCGKLIAIGNYVHKIYCNYDCAHRQAVRENRRRTARNKATKGQSVAVGAKGRRSN